MVYGWLKPGTGTAMLIELDYSIQFEDDQPGGENLKRVLPCRCLLTDFL
jgi:hypothetical protein